MVICQDRLIAYVRLLFLVGTIALKRCLNSVERNTRRSIEFRYVVTLVAVFTLFAIANVWDYVRFSRLIAAYDYSIAFGVPFVMVFEGGAMTIRPEIVWYGVAANVFLVLWSAGAAAWLWHRIAAK
jgi:hypothetical protein